MAGVAKKDEILEVAASSKSPKDLEAEIAAAADAIGGAQTVAGTPVYEIETDMEPAKPKKKTAAKKKKAAPKKKTAKKAPAKKAVAEKTVVKQAPKKKMPQKKGKVMATSDVRPAPKTPKKVTKATVTSPEESSPSAVKVTVGAKKRVSEEQQRKPEKKPALSHHAKKITPIGDVTKLKEAQKEAIPKRKPASPEPIAVKTSVKVASAKPAPKKDKPYAVVHAKPAEQPMPAAHHMTKAKPPVEKHEKHTPHVARIYDTRTYHIPISVDHHHRKAMMPHWVWALVLLLAVAAMAAVGFGFVEI